MNPYFIFKGIRSDEMGLIVESLPAITRPKMRVETIEIDGKDGEELIDLGYEAYDKTIVFGITNTSEDYIDKLMQWLTGEGYLITSVEPTKQYECKAIKALDLERLCRFRKGKLKLHTQPYKYVVNEIPVRWDGGDKIMTVINEGNVVSEPLIIIYGSGTVNISMDDKFICRLDFGEDDQITMDSREKEAYDNTSLRNRSMTGDFIVLTPGSHTITWDGEITEISIFPGSRWV